MEWMEGRSRVGNILALIGEIVKRIITKNKSKSITRLINDIRFGNVLVKHKPQIQKVIDLLEDQESKEIYKNLINGRITNESQYFKLTYTDEVQYFPNKILNLTDNEIFVDGGGVRWTDFIAIY